MNQREVLISWLNDAYGLEKQLVQALEQKVKHAENHPEMRSRFESHLAQTRRHAELVEQCINQLGGQASTTKSMMAQVTGMWEGMTSGTADDALVKDCLAAYSMENLEIASYKSLIAAAEQIGETQVAETCRQILRDEQEMAQWLDDHLSGVTQGYVSQQQAA